MSGRRMTKGQQDVISTILISGVLIGVVSSVYFWGIPLIQKNQDISTLKTAEDFMYSLNEKIKFVANNGGKDQIFVNVPGLLEFDSEIIELSVNTQGTIYATDVEIPLKKNECTRIEGTWGVHESSVVCVKSRKLAKDQYKTIYTLNFIKLNVVDSGYITGSYKIRLIGDGVAGDEHIINIENAGVEKGDVTETKILLTVD